jgi:hypothetical protein
MTGEKLIAATLCFSVHEYRAFQPSNAKGLPRYDVKRVLNATQSKQRSATKEREKSKVEV